MKLDYIPLASVPTAESLGASAKVLVVDDGEIKKTAKANVGEHPSGKLTITGTSEVNCAAYATAQVSDENLVAGNIKKDVVILGTTGSYEGSGGSGDLTTVKVTFVNQSASFGINVNGAIQFESDTYPATMPQTIVNAGDTVVITAIAYKGEADFDVSTQNSNPLGNSIATSGDVTGNGYGMYYITGDCTFTMTDVV